MIVHQQAFGPNLQHFALTCGAETKQDASAILWIPAPAQQASFFQFLRLRGNKGVTHVQMLRNFADAYTEAILILGDDHDYVVLRRRKVYLRSQISARELQVRTKD